MTSSGLKKKKKKAAKKKKKKLLNKHKDNNNKGNNHSSSTTIQQGEVDLKSQKNDDVKNSCNSKLIQEESGCSSFGLDLESKTMEGSGSNNGVEKSETEPVIKEEEVVEPVREVESLDDSVSRTVSIEGIAKEESGNGDSLVDDNEKLLGSSISHEEHKLIEKPESLKEEALEKTTEPLKEEELEKTTEPLKEEELEKSTEPLKEEKSVVEEVPAADTVLDTGSSINEVVTDDDPVEKVFSVSEELPKVVKDIPIVEEIKNLEANESLQKETANKIVETPVGESVVIEKTEASDVPASNESEDKVVAAAVDAPNVDTEVAEESRITERSQNEENVLIVPPMVQKASWMSCCGLFEAVSSRDR